MQFVRAFPVVVAGWLLSAVSQLATAEILPDASFNSWAGVVNVIDLPDGTELYEYSAQSVPEIPGGAFLSISFIPRFNCLPVVQLHTPDRGLSENDEVLVEMFVGNQSVTYPGYIDIDGENQVYSLLALSSDLLGLRNRLDLSSTVRVRVSHEFADKTQRSVAASSGAELAFSLYGSALTAHATELHCRKHSVQSLKSRRAG